VAGSAVLRVDPGASQRVRRRFSAARAEEDGDEKDRAPYLILTRANSMNEVGLPYSFFSSEGMR
jgi:hypothetical protein